MPRNKSRASDARKAMIVKKITTGFVIQDYDTERKRFVSQEFVAGECEYEDVGGEVMDPSLLNQEDGTEAYLAFEMKQPEEKGEFQIHELGSTYADPDERFVVSLIVTYANGGECGVKTPEEAVAAALALTTDDGARDTQWYCYDRDTQKMHMVEQGDAA